MAEPLFTKLEFRHYDLFVPFICRGCGGCCQTYTPMIAPDRLVVIARYLRMAEAEVLEGYGRTYRQTLVGRPVPCFFCRENRCLIYHHSLRPDVCRLYPFSFGRPPIDRCPAYAEHSRIINGFLSGEEDCEIYDSSFCPNRNNRPPPETEWPRLIFLLARAGPSREIARRFLKMNNLPRIFLRRRARKHPPWPAARASP